MLDTYKRISGLFFGRIADKFSRYFEPLKPHLMRAGIDMLLRSWVCIILFSVSVAYLGSLSLVLVLKVIFSFEFIIFLSLLIAVPVGIASAVFIFFYLYPMERARSIEKSIEINLPFALAHMSAIASSGIPPEIMFRLLIGFKEYAAISEEARLIVRNIKTFGMSSVNAITDVASKTPSRTFKQILLGITATIEKGGNLVEYLKEMSDKALFDYRIKREEYLKTLSTYADIYTALLVAAPLMMLAILGVMGIIGGEILGLSIQELIVVITWIVLPFLNITFLAFIHITYPGV